jgi:hypothetical protein
LGSKDGKVGRDMGLFSRFPVHFPFFFKPVNVHSIVLEKLIRLAFWLSTSDE